LHANPHFPPIAVAIPVVRAGVRASGGGRPMFRSLRSGRAEARQSLYPILVTSLVGAVPVTAQESAPLEVEEVVVSGTRSAQSSVTVPASITVITREEIEASGATHVIEVLRGQGTVQVFDSFGDGSRAQVGMRGFGETANANTLVLVDGRRLNNADIGPPDLNSIALEDVERIEIIQGSAGSLFGDQAVGGVINIITRKPREFTASVEPGYGSYDHRAGRVNLANRWDNGISFRFSGEQLATDNYRDHNDKDYSNYVGVVEFEHGRGSVFVDLQRVNEELELPGGLTEAELAADRRQANPAFPNDELETDTYSLRGGIRQYLFGAWSLEGEIAYRESDTDGIFFDSDFDSGRTQREVTPRLIGNFSNRFGETLVTIGADLRESDFDLDTSLGFTRNRQDVHAFYGQAVIPIAPRWSLTLGARGAWMQNDVSTQDFPGGLDLDDDVFVTEVGLSYRPTANWRLFFRRDENFRFAKSDEVTFTPPGVVGLDTQTGTSWEVGAEWSSLRGHSFKIVGFYLPIDDEIAFDPTVVGPFSPFIDGANVNLDATVRTGFNVEGSWAVNEALRLAGAFTYTDAEFDSGGLDGNKVPFVAEAVARLSADYRFTDWLSGYAELQSISDRYLIGDNENNFPQLGGYTLLNLGLRYLYRNLTLAARVNNVTDKEYVDTASPGSFFPAPERNFWVSARLDFH
jgi:iron complex outermembrane receptor protein